MNLRKKIMKKFIIKDEYISVRLDKALASLLEGLSRSKIQEYLTQGLILVNSKVEKASYRLESGDVIEVNEFPKQVSELVAEDIPIDMLRDIDIDKLKNYEYFNSSSFEEAENKITELTT